MMNERAGLDWMVEWGIAHNYPQMVFTEIVPVDPMLSEEITETFRNLQKLLHDT